MNTLDTLNPMLIAHTCGECGVVFGLPDHMLAQRKQDGATFYCPNGHARAFRESENKKLRDQLTRKEHALEQAQANSAFWRKRTDEEIAERHGVQRKLVSTRGVVTRIKNRVRKGACPCCSKSFADLKAHMDTQHPGYAGEEVK